MNQTAIASDNISTRGYCPHVDAFVYYLPMRELVLYEDYSREEVHAIFDPDSNFTPQAWRLALPPQPTSQLRQEITHNKALATASWGLRERRAS